MEPEETLYSHPQTNPGGVLERPAHWLAPERLAHFVLPLKGDPMKLILFGKRANPGADFDVRGVYEFEELLRKKWKAVLFCEENTDYMLTVYLDNTEIADMTVREVATRLQTEVDKTHEEAEHWHWFRLKVEKI